MFIRAFRPVVRVLLDWEQLESGRFAVQLTTVSEPTSLDYWYTPWYFDAQGNEVSYDMGTATPVSISQAADGLKGLSSARQQSIEELTIEFSRRSDPIQIPVAMYTLTHGRCLVLDGSHRLIAAAISKRPFIILSFVVHGPLNASILPDLAHWM